MSLMPIKSAPKTRAIMLVDEDGAHVEAKWMSISHEGETIWKGWAYCDQIMQDICPEGPSNPKFWYEKPTETLTEINATREAETVRRIADALEDAEDTKGLTVIGARRDNPSANDWRGWRGRVSRFQNFPGTPAQAVEVSASMRQDPSAKIIGVSPLYYAEMATVSFSSDIHAETPCEYTAEKKSILCPVIDSPSRGRYLIGPDGALHPVNGPII